MGPHSYGEFGSEDDVTVGRVERFFDGFQPLSYTDLSLPAISLRIAELMAERMHYRFDAESLETMRNYIERRIHQPNFANARSIRNALDRARLRQANRLFARAMKGARASVEELTLIASEDLLSSRVFQMKEADSGSG